MGFAADRTDSNTVFSRSASQEAPTGRFGRREGFSLTRCPVGSSVPARGAFPQVILTAFCRFPVWGRNCRVSSAHETGRSQNRRTPCLR